MNCRIQYVTGEHRGKSAVVREVDAMALQAEGTARIVQRTEEPLAPVQVGSKRTREPAEKTGRGVETKDD